MKIILKNNHEIEINEYENKENAVTFKCKDLAFSAIPATFTKENTEKVTVINDLDETVAEYQNYVLGDRIVVNQESGITEVTIEQKEPKEAVSDITKIVESIKAEATQNTADIDAINEAIAALAEIVGGE